MNAKDYLKSKGFEHPISIETDTTNGDYLLSELLEEYASQRQTNEAIIEKQEEYIQYLVKAINSESIISAITLGVRNQYESELASLKQK